MFSFLVVMAHEKSRRARAGWVVREMWEQAPDGGGSIKYVASQQKGTPVDLVQKLAGYWLRGPDAERDADEGIGLLKGDQDVEQQS
jgi:hypothetical protein